MNESDYSTIRWYANPRNWGPASSKQSPYSSSAVSSMTSDRGAEARKCLNIRGTTGGLIQVVLDLLGEDSMNLVRKTGMHPGRLADLLEDAADPLNSERTLLAQALGISENEF